MTSWLVFSIAAVCAIGPSVSGCSLSKFERSECSKSAECRESFGFGSTCGQEGYCEKLVVAPRCRETFPADLFTNPSKYEDAIVFGNLMDRSEPKKRARELSARLAVLQASQEPSLDGRPFGIVFCTIEENMAFDDLSLEEAAVASARWLANDLGVPAIVGPSGSSSTSAVYQALVGTNTLVISPSATSAALTTLDTTNATDENPGLLWRTAPSDSAQGPVIAGDMSQRGVNRVAVIHQADEYGQGLANIFSQTFGGEIDLHPFANDNQRTEAIVNVGATSAEEVLFIASNSDEIVAFLNGANATPGFATKTIFLTDAAASKDVFTAASGASALFPSIRGTRVRPLEVKGAYGIFVTGYQGEYGEDVKQFSFTAQAYDAAWLVMYGSAWSLYRTGSVNGRGIAQGLRKVSCLTDGATQPCNNTALDVISSNWATIAENFRTGMAVEVRGASGDLNFDLATEETLADIEVWEVTGSGNVTPVVP
jgi:ABC-type branched-subunit amino acid transport system substrate-binding protein